MVGILTVLLKGFEAFSNKGAVLYSRQLCERLDHLLCFLACQCMNYLYQMVIAHCANGNLIPVHCEVVRCLAPVYL